MCSDAGWDSSWTPMLGLCETVECRRVRLLAYFGQQHYRLRQLRRLPGSAAGLEWARSGSKVLNSAVYRAVEGAGAALRRRAHHRHPARQDAPDRPSASTATRRCRYSASARICRDSAWRGVLRQLLAQGLLTVDTKAMATLALTEASREVAQGRTAVDAAAGVAQGGPGDQQRRNARAGPQRWNSPAAAQPVFEALRAWRAVWRAIMACRPM